jgi:hypothetical protein
MAPPHGTWATNLGLQAAQKHPPQQIKHKKAASRWEAAFLLTVN